MQMGNKDIKREVKKKKKTDANTITSVKAKPIMVEPILITKKKKGEY